ncbi:MAG TPA: MetQ/NlpA family ABC transporter substrate-binding protein [Candidatus Eisenbergiella stercorigallinarum]|uniref:MetQ/NlpA family ABC transporter substrate-binding protein n=1 Tax=Candidatus Eisenbergiella stercorigallinarum TaxID=2838557 RepID=A0A9D2R034_9FIRM|nr:MetQ/NlpA family ABC transporter substrate-binding protein [Candidatus Eisenbergiella stercorigallinarum]
MKKKVLSLITAAFLTAGLLAGCGSDAAQGTGADSAASTESTAAAQTAESENAQESAVAETGASETEAAGSDAAETQAAEAKGTITVAATSVPHAEILAAAAPLLAEQGWTLEVTEFTDYIMPNEVVESEEIDANYFQHITYLESFNEERGTHLVSAGSIHYEPLGIYPGKQSDLAAITDGAEIAVPNDTTNEARALLLLQEQGLITLNADAGINATVNDITDNPHNISFIELAAEQIPRSLPDFDFAVINGNYALQAGLNASTDALAVETSDSEAVQKYVNVVAVKEGNENSEGIQALVSVLKSDEIRQYIEDTYQGSVVPFEE